EIKRLGPVYWVEEIALYKLNPLGNSVLLGVSACYSQGVGTDVNCRNQSSRMMFGNRNGKIARSGSDVDDAGSGQRLGQRQAFHDPHFAVGSGNHHRRRHLKLE